MLSWTLVTNTRITGTHAAFDAFMMVQPVIFLVITLNIHMVQWDHVYRFNKFYVTTPHYFTATAYRNGLYFQFGSEGIATATNGSNWSIPEVFTLGITSHGSQYVAVGQITT